MRLQIKFIQPFTEIMYPPVFTIQEHDHRAVCLRVQAGVFNKALHQRIPEHGLFPVIPGVAQQQGPKILNRRITYLIC